MAVPPKEALSWLASTCSCSCCCPAAPPFRNNTFARVTGSMKGDMHDLHELSYGVSVLNAQQEAGDQKVEKSMGGLAMNICPRRSG